MSTYYAISVALLIERRPSTTFVIGITGFGKGFGMAIDRFYSAAALDDCSRITMSDFSRRFFLTGLQPDFNTFEALLGWLDHELANAAPERLLVTGASAGGHTALLLGHLLQADHVVAFAPFTYLSENEAHRHGDQGIERAYVRRGLAKELEGLNPRTRTYLDLRNLLAEWNGVTRYMVHVPRYRRWDVYRANYLRGVPNLSIHTHPYAVHTVARSLARDGELSTCFEWPYSPRFSVKRCFRHVEENPKLNRLAPVTRGIRKVGRLRTLVSRGS